MPTKQQEIFQKIKEELKKTAKITVKEDVLNALDGKKEGARPKRRNRLRQSSRLLHLKRNNGVKLSCF